MSRVENPAAFPVACDGAVDPGMTLRDYFAGQVLACAAALPFGDGDYMHRAKVAYAQADAMLAERAGGAQ